MAGASMETDCLSRPDVVYYALEWPSGGNTMTDIEKRTAAVRFAADWQGRDILDVRDLYPDAGLADLFNETTMPTGTITGL